MRSSDFQSVKGEFFIRARSSQEMQFWFWRYFSGEGN